MDQKDTKSAKTEIGGKGEVGDMAQKIMTMMEKTSDGPEVA